MHTAKTARRALDLLWNNYLTLGDQVDLEMMLPERIDNLYDQNADARPYWIAAWLLRQGNFISAWSFWEYYARGLCQSLPNKKTKLPRELTVDWIRVAHFSQTTFTSAISHGSPAQIALESLLCIMARESTVPKPKTI